MPLAVWIISGDQEVRRILRNATNTMEEMVQTRLFSTCQEALTSLADGCADLVLLDHTAPTNDCSGFVREFRGLPGCADIPLLVVVNQDEMLRAGVLAAGATDILSLPLEIHEARARCRVLLSLRKQSPKTTETMAVPAAEETEFGSGIASRLSEQISIDAYEKETLMRLARAGEYRDQHTGDHINRIGRFSRMIAEGLGLSEEECDVIEAAAPLHDIGKIGISDALLLKPGTFNEHEFRAMQAHTVIGYEILKNSPSRYMQVGAEIALGHHEKFDGSGYPFARKGDQIPLAARIVAVADVYDALKSKRPYKEPWSESDSRQYLLKHRGSAFDPLCVDAFIGVQDNIVDYQQYAKLRAQTA